MADKKVTCRVVQNYGGFLPGQTITIDEREYNRFRLVDGEGNVQCPVLISSADQAELDKKAAAEREAKLKLAIADAQNGSGWSELEKQSLAIVQAKYAEAERAKRVEQDRLAGDPKPAQK